MWASPPHPSPHVGPSLAMRLAAAAAIAAAAAAAVVASAAVAVDIPDVGWADAVSSVTHRAAAVPGAAGGSGDGGTPPPAALSAAAVEDGLRAALQPAVTATGAGATYAVSVGGRVAAAGALGVAVVEHGVPMTASTVTDVGSVSKQFTAFLVYWLADRGDVDLDEDVRRYLPWLPRWDATVTLRHLVHQVSGLRDYFYVLYLGGDALDGPFPRARALAAVARQTRLRFHPGSAWEYSNTNSLLLAEVLEAVTGVSYAELLAAVVTRPLRMNATSVYDAAARLYPGLAPSVAVNVSLPVTPGAAPEVIRSFASRWAPAVGPGGILSTPVDLLRWSANMENNTLGGGQRLVTAMRTPYELRFANGSAGPPDYTVLRTGYAAGLFPLRLLAAGSDANARVPAWWHGGSRGGYQSTLLQVPAAGVAVAIQATAAQIHEGILLRAAVDAAAAAAPNVLAPLPASPPPPSPSPPPPPAATMPPSPVALPRAALDALAGVWVLAVEGAPGRDETVFELQVDCAAPSRRPRVSLPGLPAAAAGGGGDGGPSPACRLLADFGAETLTHLTAASATRFVGSPVGVPAGVVLDVSRAGGQPAAAVRFRLAPVGGPSLNGTARRPPALQVPPAELAAAAGTWASAELGATWTLTPRGGGLGVSVRGQEGGVVASTLLPCGVDGGGGWRRAYTSRRLSPLAPTLGLRAAVSATARFARGGGGDAPWALTVTAGGDGRGDFVDIPFRRAAAGGV